MSPGTAAPRVVTDPLTPLAYARGVSATIRALQKPMAPDVITWGSTLLVNTNGDLTSTENNTPSAVLRVMPGQRAEILRIIIWSQGASPAAPVTSGWIAVFRNSTVSGAPEAFFPDSPDAWVIPNAYVGGGGAFWMKEGEKLLIKGSGLTPGLGVDIAITYRLYDAPARNTPAMT
jgi:hypothetical protein